MFGGLDRDGTKLGYLGPDRRARTHNVMTVPGTKGRVLFDGTITFGNVLIVLSMVGSLVVFLLWLGGKMQNVSDQQSFNSTRLAQIEVRLSALESQTASIQDQVHLIQQQNAAFARALGAPLPPRLRPSR